MIAKLQASLEEIGSYEAAIAGCECVVHMASPFTWTVKPGHERDFLIEPALRLTETVLNAVEKVHSVKRVVMTSSIGALWTTLVNFNGVVQIARYKIPVIIYCDTLVYNGN